MPDEPPKEDLPEYMPPQRSPAFLRYGIVALLFFASSVNYADRSALSASQRGLERTGIDDVSYGLIAGAFGWSYVLAQIPSGYLLDRFGPKRIYGWSIFIWSILILLHGATTFLTDPGLIFLALLVLNYLVGLAEAPAFPGNGRVVAQWFPTKERGTASAIFNSSQYFSTVMFLPLMGFLAKDLGWPWIFWVMGSIGILLTLIWFKTYHSPKNHPFLKPAEFEYIKNGGALVDVGEGRRAGGKHGWFYARQLLNNRMLVGVYLGQYCITTLTYFFVQWVMPYLIKERHLSVLEAGVIAALPAICGFAGGVLGGLVSDYLLHRGHSLSFARKLPIISGMLIASTVLACNYVHSTWIIIAILCFSFFGKGFGALGWTVVADTSPREILGLCGGVFNVFGNSAQITLSYVSAKIIQMTHSYNLILLYVAANALMAIVAYAFIVGPIKRLELKDPEPPAPPLTSGTPTSAA